MYNSRCTPGQCRFRCDGCAAPHRPVHAGTREGGAGRSMNEFAGIAVASCGRGAEFVIDHLPIQTRSARQGGVVMRLPRLIAALAVAGFVLAPTARADAQTAVAIDADDIGGVGTRPPRPAPRVRAAAATQATT